MQASPLACEGHPLCCGCACLLAPVVLWLCLFAHMLWGCTEQSVVKSTMLDACPPSDPWC